MRDLRVISAKALLEVQSIAPVRGLLPPSIMILGRDFQRAVEVELNGVLVSEYIIQSPSRIIARIPDAQVGQVLTSVRVYTSLDAAYDSAQVSFGITRPLRTLSGIDRLVQAWLLLFFTNPGSDIFSPDSGGGARSLVGKNTDAGQQSAAADLALCIDRTKTELLRTQAQVPGLPLEERLMSSSLVGVHFDPDSSILFATVSLISMANTSALLSLG